MSKAIIDLQMKALDEAKSVSSVVRKALVIAHKLELKDFQDWCEKELRGYNEEEQEENKPAYRRVKTTLRAVNPYRGLIPVISDDSELMDALTNVFIGFPIGEVESVIDSDKDSVYFAVPPEVQQYLIESSGHSFEVRMSTSKHTFVRIVEAVRNNILEWTVNLEKSGIVGEDLEFTEREKSAARSEIHNWGTLVMGDVSHSDVRHDTINSDNVNNSGLKVAEVQSLANQIVNSLSELPIEQKIRDLLRESVDQVKVELEQKLPNPSKVASLFGSIRNLLESTTGSIIATGIVTEINRFFPI